MNKEYTGRIIRSLSGFYDVQTPEGLITCRGRGSLRKKGESPLTGDLVKVTVENGKGMVEAILPRRNSFIRPAVANVGVPVHLCINKCDLDPALDLERIYREAGFSVIVTSAETGEGVEQLRQLLKGKLTAFTGNSGVGKSSILNSLCPELQLPTGEGSEKLGRGRHTPRHVELYRLDEDTYVADTPGFSSFDTDQMDLILKENLQYAFPDFGPYLGECQFHDCSHRKEPGCAVTAAVKDGRIQPTRYDSYLRLYEKVSQIKLWEIK